MALAANPRYVRSGTRPYPYSEPLAGLHEEDIDGDGRILQMRIRDPHGDWKISSLDNRLMEKRGPDEHEGEFFRLLPEGRLEEFDGVEIKLAKPLQGLDFNRNFPFEWQPESTQAGAGPFPASEERDSRGGGLFQPAQQYQYSSYIPHTRRHYSAAIQYEAGRKNGN